VNRAAASFAKAKQMAQEALNDKGVSVFIANTQRGHYSGPILAETDMHVVQQIGAASVVAHFKSALSTVPTVGTECRVAYDNKQGMVTATAARPSAQDAKASARFVGVIHEVTDKAVVQMTGERGATRVVHDKAKLYKLGGGMDALLSPGAAVVIEYGTKGMGRVQSADPQNDAKRGLKR
jgi:hypothetical protein